MSHRLKGGRNRLVQSCTVPNRGLPPPTLCQEHATIILAHNIIVRMVHLRSGVSLNVFEANVILLYARLVKPSPHDGPLLYRLTLRTSPDKANGKEPQQRE